MRALITGATGFIGRELVRALAGRGWEVLALSRSAEGAGRERLLPGVRVLVGDPSVEGPWADALDEVDAVVHLAGEPIARRWTPAVKEAIRTSRIASARLLAARLARSGRPATLVSTSAVGYYGFRHGDEELDEAGGAGDDFLARLCVDWEAACAAPGAPGLRAVQVRVGIVLGPQGGVLAKMAPPFRAFLGGPVGSGRQWISWIHRADLVGLYLLALDRGELRGPLNGVAPTPVRMRDFARAIGRSLGRPSWLPVPGAVVRLGMGEAADVVLEGQRVVPRAALAAGYVYRYPTLEAALDAALRPERPQEASG